MKRVFLALVFSLMVCKVFATGEPSTYFNIYLPPNNDPTHRYVALVVTAIYDSTSFSIVDDDMDGDSDDSHSGMLMAGQSYILYIKDNGVNDDSDWSATGEQKADGDYFIITSNKLVYASQSTDSDWQHDWMPATNKSSKGERFILYTPRTSNSNRDVNVFAYENETTVTVRKISVSGTTGTGYTDVDINNREIVVQQTINVGQDLINYFTDGQNILESGHTYVVESNKPVTVQYGALHENARDGGGYVPSSTGGSSGDLFYFSVPYQTDTEQEIRVISLDDANDVMLERYDNGNWVLLKSWTLNQRKAAEWVGKREGNVTFPTVFRVTCSTGKEVMVLEANWMETGSPGTSDMATMATSMSGESAGKDFLVYMAPPGYQNNATDPFTGQKLDAGTHAYLFAFNKAVNVTVKDANTNGQVINRTYNIAPGRYADCNLNLSEWQSIYNGDGNPDSGTERPYLIIESDENISVLVTNFNDNWMNYFGSSLEQSFKQTSSSTSKTGVPGDTVQIETVISNESEYAIEDANVSVIVPDGLSPVNTKIKNLTTGEESSGSFTTDESTGQSTGTFDDMATLDPNTDYEVISDAVIDIKYNDGTVIDEGAVFAVETVTSGTVDGVYQESTSASGVSVASSDASNLIFSKDESGIWASKQTNSWTANWVDYDGDNDLDLFVPSYGKQQPNLIYRNIGNGQFQEVTSSSLATIGAATVSSAWADYDNDGDLDVALANNLGVASSLWLNNGSGSFEQANSSLNNTDGYDHGVSWVDANNDGYLDLFMLDFLTVKFNRMYLHNGEDLLLDVGNALGEENQRSIGASWADFDNDGLQDVFIPNGSADGSGSANSLYRNLGNGKFEKINSGAIATDVFNSVASTWGDYNNDGFIDLFVANASNKKNQLYKNNGDGTFSKQDVAPFNSHPGNSHGCSWLDYDNDGDLDLLVLNNGGQGNFLYRNNGDETFSSIDYELITAELPNAMGLSIADMDKDGDLDVFVATHSGTVNHLFTNNGNSNNWTSIKLIGTNSNRSGIGAEVKVKTEISGAAVWQSRQVSSQNGIGGQNSLNQHFGLRKAGVIDSIMVKWPSGTIQYLTNQSVNQEIVITEAQTSTVSGLAYIDANGNCIYDETEKLVPNVGIELNGFTVYTDSLGQYSATVVPGNYTVALASSDSWQSSCSAEQMVDVVTINSNYADVNFALSGKYNSKDLKVTLGTTALRRGFHNDLVITYENNGTELATNEIITLELTDDLIAISASIPWDNEENNIYSWHIDSLKVGEHRVIEITDSVSLEAPLGSAIPMTVQISDLGDYNVADNSYTLEEEVVGAVDPNDLQASPMGWGPDHLITTDDRIRYKIRFQNVGNYYAQHVFVKDQLPIVFDMETFMMESASHAYELELDGHLLKWTFKNIELPDSTRDEKGSHGYIVFSIRPQQHITSGTEVQNVAEIIFDYEKPILTNTIWHKVLNGTYSQANRVKVFPNPMTDKALISLMPSDKEPINTKIIRVEVYDTRGFLVKKVEDVEERASLTREGLTSGLYLLKVTNEVGVSFGTRLIVK